MGKPLSTDKLAKLKAQKAKLDAKIQLAEARHKTTQRKEDTRRKILVGAYYLEQAEKTHGLEVLTHQLDSFLTRDSDRQLFGLPPCSFKKASRSLIEPLAEPTLEV